MPATRNPTSSGEGTQSSGGMGDPYVGTGWTNLSNFLNPTNLEFGAGMIGPAESMDIARGRGVEEPAFENWMKSASGNTSQKPSDTPPPPQDLLPPPIWNQPPPTKEPLSPEDRRDQAQQGRWDRLNNYLTP